MVARYGSIKEASEKLHVTQPTISDQLKLVEEYFNCQLFERKNRSLFLTKEGKMALEYAEKIFELGNEVTYRLRNKIDIPKKTIDIGVTHFMSHYFLYDTILPLLGKENISVRVKEGDRNQLLIELEEGKMDMVFTDTKEHISTTMVAYRVGLNRTFVVAHKDFRKYKKNFPDSLSQIPCFNYTNDSILKYEIELFFAKNGISPKIIGEADDIDLFQVVCEKALGFVIVPEVAKNRLCINKDIIVLGEISELQTSAWGIIKNSYKGLGYNLLKEKK